MSKPGSNEDTDAEFDPTMSYDKYQKFVVETLEPRLKTLLAGREVLVEKLDGYAMVPAFVAQQEKLLKEAEAEGKDSTSVQPIRKLVDVGCGVVCQAVAVPSGTICLSLETHEGEDGSGTSTTTNIVEFTYAQAIVAANERAEALTQQCEKCDADIGECVNDIEDILATLQQLQQMHGVGPSAPGAPVV